MYETVGRPVASNYMTSVVDFPVPFGGDVLFIQEPPPFDYHRPAKGNRRSPAENVRAVTTGGWLYSDRVHLAGGTTSVFDDGPV